MGERVAYFTEILKSSEMYCSLRYEDFRGCPYNKFTPCGIAAMTIASAALAMVSLALGA